MKRTVLLYVKIFRRIQDITPYQIVSIFDVVLHIFPDLFHIYPKDLAPRIVRHDLSPLLDILIDVDLSFRAAKDKGQK